jgi:hypothetical protein
MNIKDHWIATKGLPLKFDLDKNSAATVKVVSGDYWYGISSSDRAKWNLVPDIFNELLSTAEECDVALKAMIDARSTEGKIDSEFDSNDFYLRIGPSMVQMEHAIFAGCEVEMEWELFELALISWKEFLGKVKRET